MSSIGKTYVNDPRISNLLSKFDGVFKAQLPSGLPPKRPVDHAIETDETAKPPMKPLYQLSPFELIAVK